MLSPSPIFMNELTKKLYKIEVGKSLTIKSKNGELEGSFLRVPSGWIYRYTIRNSACCCFIPYSEEVNYWDMNLEIRLCPFCKSKNVFVVYGESKFKVSCSDCRAATKEYDTKKDAVEIWNSIILATPRIPA